MFQSIGVDIYIARIREPATHTLVVLAGESTRNRKYPPLPVAVIHVNEKHPPLVLARVTDCVQQELRSQGFAEHTVRVADSEMKECYRKSGMPRCSTRPALWSECKSQAELKNKKELQSFIKNMSAHRSAFVMH